MRAYVCVAAVLLSGWAAGGFADPAHVNPDDLDQLYSMLHAPNATEMPRDRQTPEGFLRYVGAPPGGYFTVRGAGAKGAFPETAAQTFVGDHLGAFVRPSNRLAFATEKVGTGNNFAYVRLQETYNGLPVFGAQMLVQLDVYNGVVCVLSDVLRDTTAFDQGAISLTPTVDAAAAQSTAIQWTATEYSKPSTSFAASDGERVIYDPGVVGATGPATVAWQFTVYNVDADGGPVKEVVFVDGHSGQMVFHYPLVHDARLRRIYDANHQYVRLGRLVREEGDPPVGTLVDVDNAYDFFGDTYDFYQREHGRDSIDGKGIPIVGIVRFCYPGDCPYQNAFYVTHLPGEVQGPFDLLFDHMYFGDGFASGEDVIGHELTHGVTQDESGLIYAFQPGAMNESFSDIWGESIELTSGRPGADDPAVRWLLGEDLPGGLGPIRNMKNPPEFFDPDRVHSPYYYKGTGDNGGVHFNSGVINKLYYLLTDGDTFNGRTITGMGIDRAIKLFYEMQVHLLTPTSDFTDLYFQLGQATINLGYTLPERRNVREAALAVEIAPDTDDELIKAFRATPSLDERGRPVIALTWQNPTSTHFRRVIIVRDTKKFPTVIEDGMEIYRGVDDKFLDTAVVAGTRYFYTIFSQMTGGFPDQRQSQAVAGGLPADFLTESFDGTSTSGNPLDLSFTQLTYSPVGPALTPLDADTPLQGDFSGYILAVKKNVTELPVSRDAPLEDGTINVDLSLAQNGVSAFPTFAPIPFFGIKYNTLYLAGNGYVAFQQVKQDSAENTVISSASHFSATRVSFLFSDLAPTSGGLVWGRILKDRIVVTFDNVPEQEALVNPPSGNPNTVQIELYYSGRIRITYLMVQAKKAVVGLSDGQGPVLDPALLFQGVQHVKVQTDLSEFPPAVSALTLEPIPPQNVTAGDEIKFVVHTDVPPGAGIPTLEAVWNGPGYPPFADSRDGTGVFDWKTSLLDAQVYTVRFTAKFGTQVAYEDVYLAVGIPEPLPEALNVGLKTNNPIEDPRRDRPVDDDAQLLVSYDYWHPGLFLKPDIFGEGPTQILWFKDDRLIPAFNDQRVVPPDATKANERWFYTVTPRTISSLAGNVIEGATRQSPTVTIASLPKILQVAPSTGPSTGNTTVVITGERFGHPVSVTFGGVEVQSITAIDDTQIQVVTPAHMPSFVIGGAPVPEDVVVTTAAGVGTLSESFTFTDAGAAISKADINRDGVVNALDVQLVINSVLKLSKSGTNSDVNCDGAINSADIQLVINAALAR